MSEDISRLPLPVQERLLRLQQVQQQLQAILTQKQQNELELGEIADALEEMQKAADDCPIYKSVGSILVKTEKTKMTTELNERKELLNTRIGILTKQEERTRTQMKDLQAKLQQDLNPVSPPPPSDLSPPP